MRNETVTPGIFTDAVVNATKSFNHADCDLFPGETWKCYTIVTIKRLACSSSVTCSLFALVIIVLFKKFQDSSHRMIVHLSVATVLFSVALCLADFVDQPSTLCRIQGALLTLFGWNCCLWIITIMCNIYFKLVYLVELNKYEILLTVFNWAFPCIVSGLPFADDMYGPAGAWCWLKTDWRWGLALWYSLRIATIVVVIVTTVHVIVIVYRIRNQRVSLAASLESVDDDISTLRTFPIMFFLVNLFPVVDSLYNTIVIRDDQSGYVFPLLLLHVVCEPLFPIVIVLVYAFNRNTRNKLNRAAVYEAFRSWRRKVPEIREYSLSNVSSERRFL